MAGRFSTTRTGQGQSIWPLALLLLVAVAVPAACVLWFMNEAMRNEQMAVRGRLTAVYEGQLETLGRRLDEFWNEKKVALEADRQGNRPAGVFAELVHSGIVDSVIVLDTTGQVTYPMEPQFESANERRDEGQWLEAWSLEFESSNYPAAADSYERIAVYAIQSDDQNNAARALWSQARCLFKTDRKREALEILNGELKETYGDARDAQGNLILPGAQLWAIEELAESESNEYRECLQALVKRLEHYGEPVLPSSQRRFLMQKLSDVTPESLTFSTFQAELLASDVLEAQMDQSPIQPPRLRPGRIDKVWELATRNGEFNLVALFTEERILEEMQAILDGGLTIPNASIGLIPPGIRASKDSAFLTGAAGEFLPDWRLVLQFDDSDPFASAANSQVAIYYYSGVVVVLGMIALAVLVTRYVTGQIRVTRLRNDLISTVSHELKTPLASIRALIDTLLEGRYHDEAQHREYLQLAAKENERLSRLIDNFLAFSRMERNKRTFEFSEVRVEEIVRSAMDAVREEFQATNVRFDAEVQDDLPRIRGDADALTTVLVDLLDNAKKYSGDDKHIILRASAHDGEVRLEVEDNGLGLSRREAKKVFERFYQVDETLSRRAGGCGLGLSIVQFIVASHNGTVGVSSQPGKGSTFTVTLPVADVGSSENH